MDRLTVTKVGKKVVHTLNLVEPASASDRVTDLDSVIKLYSAIGVIIFGANEEFLAQPELFDNVSRVFREGTTHLPMALVRTKREHAVLSCLIEDNSKAALEKLVFSEEQFRTDASLAGKREILSSDCQLFNEFKKNKNKVHPTICGAFSTALFTDFDEGFAGEMLFAFKKAGIIDSRSPEFLADILGRILAYEDKKNVTVNSAALSADFAEFTCESISITPNVFNTLCSAYSADGLDANGEAAVLGSWLVLGVKYDEERGSALPEAAFVNSLRSVFRTYLKKSIVVSPDVAAKVTDNPEALHAYRAPYKSVNIKAVYASNERSIMEKSTMLALKNNESVFLR